MKNIPFLKYTSCGNNFVIVDNTQAEVLSESEFSFFATKATNMAFGIGCDNLVVVQSVSARILDSITRERDYWQTIPDWHQAQFIFRMFEPNGEEALCCGNGLACVADLLRRKYRISSSRIMTEIPLTHPRILNIGSANPGQGGWANLGVPRKTPSILANNRNLSAYDEVIDFIELPIQFRQHDLKPYTNATKLSLRAYLVFTGEPHLVVFAEEGFSEPKLASYLFGSLADTTRHPAEQRSNFGNWLVNRVGHHLNVSCRDIFPYGVNVNFARFINPTTVENRCFERGVNKETLACGTGALAVAYVIQKLKPQVSSKITVLPVKCRLQQPEAKMDIQQTQNGWLLNTNPQLLFKGEFQLADPPLLPGSVHPQGADLVTGRQSQARIQRN